MRASSTLALRLGGGVLASGLAILTVVWFVDVPRTLTLVATANVWLVLGSLAMVVVVMYCRAARWQLLLPGPNEIGTIGLLAVLFQGYSASTILPFRAGDALRVVITSRRGQIPKVVVLASVLVEQALDLLVLGALFFLQWLLLPAVIGLPLRVDLGLLTRAAVIGLVAAVGAVVAILAARRALGERWERLVQQRLYSGFVGRIRLQLAVVISGLAHCRQPRHLGAIAAWTAAVWLASALTVHLGLLAMGIAAEPAMTLFVVVLTNLGLAVPSAPGNIGVYDAAVVGALAVFGVNQERALAAALVLHATSICATLLGGAVAFSWAQVGARVEQPVAAANPLSTEV